MGGMFVLKDASTRRNKQKEHKLEVDVRENLKALDLPLTSKGAGEASIHICRWTSPGRGERTCAWPKEVLDAALAYINADAKQRILSSLA